GAFFNEKSLRMFLTPNHRSPVVACSSGVRPPRHRHATAGLRRPRELVHAATSSDPDEFSSSEEGEALEAAVISSEAEDRLDGEEGRPIPCPVTDLSPIVEEDEDR
ncbi:hypothetical protein Dimus_008478, partial [Dionaea muscipula]